MNNNIITKATAVVLGAGVAAMLAAGSASAAAPAATPRIAHTSHVAGTAGTRTITLGQHVAVRMDAGPGDELQQLLQRLELA